MTVTTFLDNAAPIPASVRENPFKKIQVVVESLDQERAIQARMPEDYTVIHRAFYREPVLDPRYFNIIVSLRSDEQGVAVTLWKDTNFRSHEKPLPAQYVESSAADAANTVRQLCGYRIETLDSYRAQR